MSVIAFVPARSGSKRLAGKNVRVLNGKPLMVWTLEACLRAKQVDKVVLSTDSEEYLEIAEKAFPGEVILRDLRTMGEAGDAVKIFDYVKNKWAKIFTPHLQHDSSHAGQAGPEDAFVLALPTAPLRTAEHVDACIDLFRSSGRAVFSATELPFPVNFSFYLDNEGDWYPVLGDRSPMVTGNTRSQDQRKAYRPNGAVYVRKIVDLEDDALTTFYDDALPYIMDKSVSVDIDDAKDFQLAEFLMNAARN